MKEADVDKWVMENNEVDAYHLFDEKLPGYREKLNRLDKRLINLLKDIQKTFPDARYYTASGGFNLTLGSTHADDFTLTAQRQRMAWGGFAQIGDGDW